MKFIHHHLNKIGIQHPVINIMASSCWRRTGNLPQSDKDRLKRLFEHPVKSRKHSINWGPRRRKLVKGIKGTGPLDTMEFCSFYNIGWPSLTRNISPKARASASTVTNTDENGVGSARSLPSNPETVSGFSSSSSQTPNSSSPAFISAEELYDLFMSGKFPQILLLDCRLPARFEQQRIRDSVNVPAIKTNVPARITSKTSIVKILDDYFLNILGSLNAPGFYTNIVIIKECASENPSSVLTLLLEGISKWNEGTRTNIVTLQADVKTFGDKYPRFVAASESLIPPWTFSSKISKNVNYPRSSSSLPQSTEMSRRTKQVIDMLTAHLKDLRSFTNDTAKLLQYKKELKSFTAVGLELEKEMKEKIDKSLETEIPSCMKCRICSKIFTGIIYQCVHGHGVCDGCINQQSHCSVCGVPEGFGPTKKIRNVALETLMWTKVTVHCPYKVNGCNLILTCGELPGHMQICETRKCRLVLKIEGQIGSTKEGIRRMNRKLSSLSKKIADAEFQINAMVENPAPEVPEKLMEQIFVGQMNSLKAKMTVNLKTFMRTGHSLEVVDTPMDQMDNN